MLKTLKLLSLCMLVITFSCSKENNLIDNQAIIISSDGTQQVMYQIGIADTKDKLYHGFMGKTEIPDNYGLLFDINLVPKDMDIAFWMKDTLISLDILFLDENGKIFYIYENAIPNDTTPIYPPKRPRAVLEINSGQVNQYGIKIGDILKTGFLGNQ